MFFKEMQGDSRANEMVLSFSGVKPMEITEGEIKKTKTVTADVTFSPNFVTGVILVNALVKTFDPDLNIDIDTPCQIGYVSDKPKNANKKVNSQGYTMFCNTGNGSQVIYFDSRDILKGARWAWNFFKGDEFTDTFLFIEKLFLNGEKITNPRAEAL